MQTPFDDEDPAQVRQWCDRCRAGVAAYLKREGVVHGPIAQEPAWLMAPYVSIWSVDAAGRPGWRGWWAICGDLPTDYVEADGLEGPRQAMRAFGERWRDVARYMQRGKPHPSIAIGKPADWPVLGPLLEGRAGLLIETSDDDAEWAH